MPFDDACDIGQRFLQTAIYYVEGDALSVSYCDAQGGVVYYAPLRIRVAEQRFREPDLVALLDAKDPRRGDGFWNGADVAVEIISPGNAAHDLVTKRTEYAQAGIREYWIVDPDSRTLTVLTLDGAEYREHGCFGRGDTVTSPLLGGLALAVADVFDAKDVA